MIYPRDFLHLDDDTVVSMFYIESMRYPSDEDLTADLIKNDPRLEISMVSGKTYSISTKKQAMVLSLSTPRPNLDLFELRRAIVEKWTHILSGKK